jgi:hypothetical protein
VFPVSVLEFGKVSQGFGFALCAELRNTVPQLGNQSAANHAGRFRMFRIVMAFHVPAFFGATP